MRRKLSTFLGLRLSEQLAVIESFTILSCTAVALRVMSFDTLRTAAMAILDQRTSHQQPWSEPDVVQVARQLARLVEVAARNLPCELNCLPSSLTLWCLLSRRGIRAELQIGVKKQEQQLAAHAWVECHGVVINDDEMVRAHFATFDRAVLGLAGASPVG